MHYARIGRSNPLTWSPPSADRPPFLKNTQSQPSRFFVPHKWGPHFKCTTVEGDPAFPRAGEGHGGSPLEYGAKPSRNFFGTPKKRGGWAWVRGWSARGPSDGAHANHRGGRSAAGPVSKVTAGYLAATSGVTARYLAATFVLASFVLRPRGPGSGRGISRGHLVDDRVCLADRSVDR